MTVFFIMEAVFNYAYLLVMAWLFDYHDYDFIASLAAIAAIGFIVSLTFQTSTAKFVSKYRSENKTGQMKRIWRFSLKSSVILGLALFILTGVFSMPLSTFFNHQDHWHIVVFSITLILLFALPVNWGVLMGTQRFRQLGATHALWAALKVIVAYALVVLGLGLYGALGAYSIAYIVVFIVTFFLLRWLKDGEDAQIDRKGVLLYTYKTLIAILAFATLTNIDIVLVTHYLHDRGASDYAMTSVIGKIALYIPAAISVAMFPKSTELFEAGFNTRGLLRKSFVLTLISLSIVMVAYWFAAEPLMNLLYGNKYPIAADYVFIYGIAMGLFALCFVMMNYLLSLNQTVIRYYLMLAMVVQVVGIGLFHSSIGQVVNVILISAVFTSVLMLVIYLLLRSRWEVNHAMAK
ncbi:MAG: hypothetical protein SVY53_02470 [Chloroflexota bacterium]|nr:hypothetical protein [Chloroflexota bacterium]